MPHLFADTTHRMCVLYEHERRFSLAGYRTTFARSAPKNPFVVAQSSG